MAQHDTLEETSSASADAFTDSVRRTASSPEQAWRAVAVISGFGERWIKKPGDAKGSPSNVQYPGLVACLAQIFRQTASRRVGERVLGAIIHQAERDEAVAFLSNIERMPVDTTVPVREGHVPVVDHIQFPLHVQAIQAVAYMAPQGEDGPSTATR